MPKKIKIILIATLICLSTVSSSLLANELEIKKPASFDKNKEGVITYKVSSPAKGVEKTLPTPLSKKIAVKTPAKNPSGLLQIPKKDITAKKTLPQPKQIDLSKNKPASLGVKPKIFETKQVVNHTTKQRHSEQVIVKEKLAIAEPEEKSLNLPAPASLKIPNHGIRKDADSPAMTKSNFSKQYKAVSNFIPRNTYKNITYKAPEALKKTKRMAVIMIDAGHGGKDPGASGALGTKEKDITYAYTLELKKELEKTGHFKVLLTRYSDSFVELYDRVKIARKANADAFISLHADSHPNKNTKGFSIYTISQDRALREAQKLVSKAEYEDVSGVRLRGQSTDVKEAIVDFAQKESKDVSNGLSSIIARHLGKKTTPLRNTNREGSLAVLTGIDIPSVLIELGYLSNRTEEKLLRDVGHKQRVVNAIRNALDEYFVRNSYLLE